ncbi:FDLD family class I lanthipeptide [Actinokineospora enzanensis]|uniref:FDLD family class I lanthipeptide n=1 Tax=Actinokineospora enzanensis TaxID=155975 RepID=UPI0003821BA0|nr:FDLD family class I lanthipeptide [Actinokineospora enzanensis]
MTQMIAGPGFDLDLTVDEEIFSAPGGGSQATASTADNPDGTFTFTTTCWGTCAVTCGDCHTLECCTH